MPTTPKETATDQSRKQYLSSVLDWSANMLKILRYIPNKVGKLALLRQVDKVKSMDISVNDLPAYAAAIAILSEKSASLMGGEEPKDDVTVEKAIRCLKSGLIKNKFQGDDDSFILLTEYLKL
jgi:hypothetical protein